jgi:hypothetical protein
MGQFDVDFDTLCVHVAEHKHEELKAEGKHPHHQPSDEANGEPCCCSTW